MRLLSPSFPQVVENSLLLPTRVFNDLVLGKVGLLGKWDDSSIVDKAGMRSRAPGKLERVHRSRSMCPE
jgi:hypothetical protein